MFLLGQQYSVKKHNVPGNKIFGNIWKKKVQL